MKRALLLSILLVITFVGCGKDPIVRNHGDKIETDITPLWKIYKNSFAMGAAAEPFQLIEGEGALLAYHFNSLTAENAMKFKSIHPEQDEWNFEGADEIAKFAKDNKMIMRGHTFVWHHPAEIAGWVFKSENGSSRTRDEVLEILKDHMNVMMDRYGDRIDYWDVVNEPIDVSQADNMRRTPWYESIGPDYVDQAFLMARELNPGAKLFLNEYDTFEPQKRTAIYDLIKGMQERNIPIDGVGLQLHLSLSHPIIEEVEKTIDLFRSLGIEIHITELDISLYMGEFESFETAPETHLIRQAHRYRELFEIFEKNNDIIKNVTFWGFNNSHSYRTGEPYNRNDWPLPFGSDLKSMPAYLGIIGSEDLANDVVIKAAKQDFTYEAPMGSPVIDGTIDEIWQNTPVVKTLSQVMPQTGAVADVRVLWDEQHIYVLAEVADSTLSNNAGQTYMNDSFEVFLDEYNDKTTALGMDDYQFRVGYENELGFGGRGWKDKIESAAVVTDSGYLVELKIILQKENGAPGKIMGMDFQVNDNFGNEQRDGISKWNDATNESWRNTTGWGTLKMIE